MKFTRFLSIVAIIFVASSFVVRAGSDHDNDKNHRRAVKVVVITMFEIAGPVPAELQKWIDGEGLTNAITVPGLSPNFPQILCKPDSKDKNGRNDRNDDSIDECLLTTDIGFANAASSIMALILSDKFDFRKTYFIVAGIAGVDPADGTLGTAAWARYAIDRSLSHEIDAREIPSTFTTGHFGFGPVVPGLKPTRTIGTEVYQLDEKLLQKAFSLTKDMTLIDNAASQAWRAHFPSAPANQPPKVTICDSISDNIYWGGSLLSKQANEWASLLTDGKANYCMTDEEDNSTLTALKRGSLAGLVDFSRVAVLRTAADFDQQYPGQTAYEAISTSQGGFIPSLSNAYLVGAVLVHDIIGDWRHWREGVPPIKPLTVVAK